MTKGKSTVEHTFFNRMRLKFGYIYVKPSHVQVYLKDGLYAGWIPEGIHYWGNRKLRHTLHQPQLSVGSKAVSVKDLACRSRNGLVVRIDANILTGFHPKDCQFGIERRLSLAPPAAFISIGERHLQMAIFESVGQFTESDLRRGTVVQELKDSVSRLYKERTAVIGMRLVDIGITGIRPDERVENATVQALGAAQFANSIEGLDPETQRMLFEREKYLQLGGSNSDVRLRVDQPMGQQPKSGPKRDNNYRPKRRDSYPDN